MSPKPTAPDRLLLMLALVPFLYARTEDLDLADPAIPISEAAVHFGVSEAELRQAIDTIWVSGLPESDGSLTHHGMFDFDPEEYEQDRLVLQTAVVFGEDDVVRLSAAEASAFIAGLQYLRSLPGNEENAVIASALGKLAAAAGIERPVSPVAVDAVATDAAVATARRAVDAGTQLEFDYRNGRGQTEHRTVDPYSLQRTDASWYLRGWCQLREDERTFRFDRITGLRDTGRPRSTPTPELASDALFQPSEDDLIVQVSVAENALGLLGEFLPPDASPRSDGSGLVALDIRVAHFQTLRRLAVGLADSLTVLGPPEARAAVAAWADAALARYETSL